MIPGKRESRRMLDRTCSLRTTCWKGASGMIKSLTAAGGSICTRQRAWTRLRSIPAVRWTCRSLWHSAGLPVFAQCGEPVLRGPQHQRHSHRVGLHARNGHLRFDGASHRHGRRLAASGRIQQWRTSGTHMDQQNSTMLLRDDAFLLAVRNEDPDDLARRASVSASCERPDSPAAAVLSGITRRTATTCTPPWRTGLTSGLRKDSGLDRTRVAHATADLSDPADLRHRFRAGTHADDERCLQPAHDSWTAARNPV